MCVLLITWLVVSGKVGYLFNHTSSITVVTPTDRPKSVRNCFVIEVFCGVFVLSIGFQIFCWYRVFCQRTESDLLFLLMSLNSYIYLWHICWQPLFPLASTLHIYTAYWLGHHNEIKRVCLWTRIPLAAAKSKFAIFSHGQGHKVIDVDVIWKGFISWVCMSNMKFLSFVQNILRSWKFCHRHTHRRT